MQQPRHYNNDPPTEPFAPIDPSTMPIPVQSHSGPQRGEFWPPHNPGGAPYQVPYRTHEPAPLPEDQRHYPGEVYALDKPLPRSPEEHKIAYAHGPHDVAANEAKALKKKPYQWFLHPGIKGGGIAAAIIATGIVWGNSITTDKQPAGSPHLELPPTQEQQEPEGMRVPNTDFPRIDFVPNGDSHVITYCTDTYVDENTGARYSNTIVTGSLEDDKFHKADFRQGSPSDGRISVSMTQDTTRVVGGHWEYEDGKTGLYPANCYDITAVAKLYPTAPDPEAPKEIRIVPVDPTFQPPEGTVVVDGGESVDFILNQQLPPAA